MFAVLEVMISIKLEFEKNPVFGAIALLTAKSKLKVANEWWNKAESLKQKAFYFDYTSVVSDPVSITKQEYESGLHRGKGIRDAVRALVDFVSKMDTENLEWFRRDFLDPDTLDLLNTSIAGNSEANL